MLLLILSLVQVLKPQIPSRCGLMSNSVPGLYLCSQRAGAAMPLTTQYIFPGLGALSPVAYPLKVMAS